MDEPTSVPKSSLVFESTSVFELLHQVFLIFEYTPMDQRRKDNVVPLSQEEENRGRWKEMLSLPSL
jgi:hypothetical protein